MFIKDAIDILEKMYQPDSGFRFRFRFSEREAAREAVKRLREIQDEEARRTVSGQEAEPVCWITREQLTRVEDEGEDAWVYWAETGHVAEPDEVALCAAPIRPSQTDAGLPETGLPWRKDE